MKTVSMNIILSDNEKRELLGSYSSYTIVPKDNVESNWVSRGFRTSGNLVRGVESTDKKEFVIHQLVTYYSI